MIIHTEDPRTALVVTLTPDDAREYLSQIVPNHRKPNQDRIDIFTSYMLQGLFTLSDSAICVNSKQELVNGVDRLYALIQASKEDENITLTTLLSENYDDLLGIDKGRIRTVQSEVYQVKGKTYTDLWYRTLTFLYSISMVGHEDFSRESKKKFRTSNNGMWSLDGEDLLNSHKKTFETACDHLAHDYPNFIAALIVLLLESGQYQEKHIEMAFHAFTGSESRPEDKSLAQLGKEYRTATGRFKERKIDVTPGGERSLKYMLIMGNAFVKYLNTIEGKPRVKKDDIEDFLFQVNECLFKDMRETVRKRKEENKAKNKAMAEAAKAAQKE